MGLDNLDNLYMIDKYKKIIQNSNDFEIGNFKTYKPIISDVDLKNGYITRYFIQRRNDNTAYIYEIDLKTYLNYTDSFYYKSVKLDWKIKGDESDVKKSNLKSINLASKNMKSIGLYLPNLLQFYKK